MELGIAIIIFQLAAVPFVFIGWFAMAKHASKTLWILQFFLVGTYLTSIWLIGPWGWISIHLKWILLALLLLAALFSYRRNSGIPFLPGFGLKTLVYVGIYSIVIAVFLLQSGLALYGRRVPESIVELAFPLKGGRFLVAHGGSSPIVNYHNENRAQVYALDITALGRFGMRAAGIYPKELIRFEIYGHEIVSPCSGEILFAEDGHKDESPGMPSNPDHPAGNHVVIGCGNMKVVLAHMQLNSIAVDVGQGVKIGDLLGLVGNSGNTSEPHLHIHAELAVPGRKILRGQGVALNFDDRFLVRNDLVVSN